jgi:hypothetical protein
VPFAEMMSRKSKEIGSLIRLIMTGVPSAARKKGPVPQGQALDVTEIEMNRFSAARFRRPRQIEAASPSRNRHNLLFAHPVAA